MKGVRHLYLLPLTDILINIHITFIIHLSEPNTEMVDNPIHLLK